MNKKQLFTAVSIILSLCVAQSAAQDKLRPRDLPARHGNWLTKEVYYIITPVERDIFLRLKTNNERDMFIEAFWRQRDPTQGTEKNEFREEHYRRFNHANSRFISAGKEGWQTDRGKIYIILGEPMEVRNFSGSDAYYPAESWYYQGMQQYGLPQAFHLLFYQKNRIGDYILYNPGMEGPWNLLSNYNGNPGDYLQSYYLLEDIEPELASLSISLIPGESTMQFPSLSSAAFLNSIDLVAIRRIKDQYAKKFIQYKDVIEVEYSANYIESDAQVRILQDDDGISHVHFAIEPKNLSMASYENSIYTNLEFSGMVTDTSGKTIFQFDRQIPMRFSPEQFEKMRQRPFSFSDVFPLIPGEFSFSLLLKNSVSKEFTSFETNIRIPEASPSPKIGQILLGFNVVNASHPQDSSSPFVAGNLQIYSQAGNSFIRQDKLYCFFQLADIPKALVQSGSVNFTFYKEDEEFVTKMYPLSKYESLLNIMEMFALENFSPGYYKLKVSVLDGNQNEVLSQQDLFEVSHVSALPRPWVMARYLIDPNLRETDFILGTEFLNSGDSKRALPLLEKAYRSNPNNPDFGIRFAECKYAQENYREALDVLIPLSEITNDSYELNELMAGSYKALGDYPNAIRAYKETIDRFGVSTSLLNSIGECYLKVGNRTEALAALEKSLEIDGSQDSVKTMIAEIKK